MIFDRLPHKLAQLDALALKPNLSSSNAGHIEQVINEVRQLIDLPLDHRPGAFDLMPAGGGSVEYMKAVLYWRQGVAQLMGQNCEQTPLVAACVPPCSVGVREKGVTSQLQECGSTQKPPAESAAKDLPVAPKPVMKAPAPTTAEIEHIQVTLRRVHFALNSSKLLKTSQAALKEAAERLRAYKDLQITVVGHADERGSDAYNEALALRRAEAVISELAKLGIESNRLAADSQGKQQPLVSGSTARAWASNRRVEFRLSDRAKLEIQDGTLVDDQGRPLVADRAATKSGRRIAAAE